MNPEIGHAALWVMVSLRGEEPTASPGYSAVRTNVTVAGTGGSVTLSPERGTYVAPAEVVSPPVLHEGFPIRTEASAVPDEQECLRVRIFRTPLAAAEPIARPIAEARALAPWEADARLPRLAMRREACGVA